MTRMPAAFFGHGSPMNALETNRYTEAWRAFAARIPRPRAILAISAHWYIGATAVTAMAKPQTIHDFRGFPPALFALDYPALGALDLAQEVAALLSPVPVALDVQDWGLDHGTWSVLVHAYPGADIPVVQLALDATRPFSFHFELGRTLSPLRERGVLILGSGNVVHNLARVDRAKPDAGFDWAARFDEAAQSVMTRAPAEAPWLEDHPDFALSAPTPEHFIPLLYLAGLADASLETADVLVDGYAMGSLSMTAYAVGLRT